MLQRVLVGSLVGAVTGGVVSFALARKKPGKPQVPLAAAAAPLPQPSLSAEAKDILDMFEPFQKWPEFGKLAQTLGELEALAKTPKPNKFDASKLATRAYRYLDAFELKNKTVLPLDLAEDLKAARKFIDDLKFNLFQASSS